MTETLIIAALTAGAVIYLSRSLMRFFKGTADSCGCCSCSRTRDIVNRR